MSSSDKFKIEDWKWGNSDSKLRSLISEISSINSHTTSQSHSEESLPHPLFWGDFCIDWAAHTHTHTSQTEAHLRLLWEEGEFYLHVIFDMKIFDLDSFIGHDWRSQLLSNVAFLWFHHRTKSQMLQLETQHKRSCAHHSRHTVQAMSSVICTGLGGLSPQSAIFGFGCVKFQTMSMS